MADQKTQIKSEAAKYTTEKAVYAKGLEGVILCDTQVSFVDGLAGKLYYRGIPIQDLAEHSTYEETAYLLLFGKLPKSKELEDFKTQLKANRNLPDEILEIIQKFPKDAHPMEALRSIVSLLGMYDKDDSLNTPEANIKISIKLMAQFPSAVAAFERFRQGKEYVKPEDNLDHSANFLHMFRGPIPSDLDTKAMDACLILHADHEMNVSTLSCRVVISSLSDMYSAVCAGVGSLKGPLHGGANEEVMKTLEEIGTLENTEKWVKDALAKRIRVPGFGHRVYKYYDPRAAILKNFSEKYAQIKKETYEKLQMAELIEKIMIETLGESKGIYPNVDLYSGIIYSTMDIPRDQFTPIFAIARVVGWCAQILEQLQDNRIYRPRCHYTGALDLPYIPIDKR